MLNSDQRTTLRVFSIAAAAVWVVLGFSMGWPLWLWIGLAVVSLVAPSLVNMVLTERTLRGSAQRRPLPDDEHAQSQPAPPPAPPQPQRYQVHDVLLQSAREDYQFVFACTVLWLPHRQDHGLRHAKPGALAAEAMLEEAAKLATSLHPRDTNWAQHHLMSALGAPRVDRTGLVQAWADDITIRLSDEDRERLNQLAEVRKDEDVWEGKCSYERKVRAYLGEDVLSTPGSAVVWWLASPRTDEKQRVPEAVAQIPNLEKLTRIVTNDDNAGGANEQGEIFQDALPLEDLPRSSGPGHPWVVAEPPAEDTGGEADTPLNERAGKLIEKLPEGPERDLFARRFADLFQKQGYAEVADEIRRGFDVSPTDSPPAPEPRDDIPESHGKEASADQEVAQRLPEDASASDERTPAGVGVTSQPADGVETDTDQAKTTSEQEQTQRVVDEDRSDGAGIQA